MKFVRYIHQGQKNYGILEGDRVLETGAPGEDWCAGPPAVTGSSIALQEVRLLAPCEPTKIVCLGLNYRPHAEELGLTLPGEPILFMKPSTAVIGPGDRIICPPESRRVDFEAELAVVIGRRAYRVNAAEALQYVFGYTCGNDVTARDRQPPDGQWTYAKGFDTFCPLGPVIETSIEDPETLPIRGLLNGRVVQEASTADHHFKVAGIIEYISACMTLLPGDVIMTGTPSGIAPLKPGDVFETVIEGIGSLSNPVSGPGE